MRQRAAVADVCGAVAALFVFVLVLTWMAGLASEPGVPLASLPVPAQELAAEGPPAFEPPPLALPAPPRPDAPAAWTTRVVLPPVTVLPTRVVLAGPKLAREPPAESAGTDGFAEPHAD